MKRSKSKARSNSKSLKLELNRRELDYLSSVLEFQASSLEVAKEDPKLRDLVKKDLAIISDIGEKLSLN